MPSRGAAIVWLTLLTLAGCAHGAAAAKASAATRPAPTAPPRPAGMPDRPATHLGRTVLPKADVIVRGRVAQLTPAPNGAVVGRVEPAEWLRGEPREDVPALVVLTPAANALPAVGRDALFLLASRRASDNLALVDVAGLDDSDGPARLAAMRRYLEIEAVADPSARIVTLRSYLREALVSDDRWTRSNAAREFAALASEVPGSLEAEDRPPLESALTRTRDRELRARIEEALAECPGAGPRRQAPAAAAPDPAASFADAMARYSAKDASAVVRRQAVVDAAVEAGARAAPLFERALDDESAPVREAAAAAAGEHRVASLEPKLAAMLAGDPSPDVRRTVVVAAGYLKSAAAVPTLAILAKEGGPFSRDAAFALARIRDDAALESLRRLAADATDAQRRELLRFLASDAFVEQERALVPQR